MDASFGDALSLAHSGDGGEPGERQFRTGATQR